MGAPKSYMGYASSVSTVRPVLQASALTAYQTSGKKTDQVLPTVLVLHGMTLLESRQVQLMQHLLQVGIQHTTS